MSYFVRYPLVGISVGWMLGLFVGYASIQSFLKLCLACLVLILGFFLFSVRKGFENLPALTTLLFILLSFLSGVGFKQADQVFDLEPGLWIVSFEVKKVFHFEDEKKCAIKIIAGRKLRDEKEMEMPIMGKLHRCVFHQGDSVKSIVRINPMMAYQNKSPHAPWVWHSPLKAHLWVPEGIEPFQISKNEKARLWENARSIVRDAITSHLVSPYSSLARSFVLGESYCLNKDQKKAIRQSGLSHVLAVSGLHVGLFVGVCFFFLLKLLILFFGERIYAARWASGAGIILALGFAFFAGGAPSALRSAIMGAIIFVSIMCYRRPHLPSVLALTVLIMTIIEPENAMRPGLLLSLLAMVALLSLNFERKKGNRFFFYLKQSFYASARTFVMTAPLVWWCFGTLPIVGLVSNLLVLPFVTFLLIPVTFLWVVLLLFGFPFLNEISFFVELFSDLFLFLCNFFSKDIFTIQVDPLTFFQGISLFFLSTLLVLFFPKWFSFRFHFRFLLVLLFPVLVFCISEWRVRKTEKPNDQFRVTFLDVGQGDAALVDLPDGKLMVIDAGQTGTKGFDLGSQVLAPLLKARRRSHIDVLVITHPHPDHYGGAQTLIDQFSVGEIWDNGQTFKEELQGPYALFLALAKSKSIPIKGPQEQCEKNFYFGEANVRWLWPCPVSDSGLNLNNNSIVLRLDYQSRSFLFTGDLEKEAEEEMMQRSSVEDLFHIDVLKVGHHGSNTSTTHSFLQIMQPKFAVISSGKFNRYGHPHPRVLGRLSNLSIPILRTDVLGSVQFHLQDGDLQYEVFFEGESD